MTNIKCNGKIECDELFIQGKRLIDFIYPVNTIYISNQNISPASIWGGTWEALPEDFCLWTTNANRNIDIEQEGVAPEGQMYRMIPAGLPNITGLFGAKTWRDDELPIGAFTETWRDEKVTPSGNMKDRNTDISFNANNGASVQGIYGNSNTVQPRAYRVYAWKRIL